MSEDTQVLSAPLTMVQGLNAALRTAMEADPRVLVMGEDIGQLGGVFRVTDGLWKDLGDERVIDTPLAESGIVGTAIGLALRGYRPVVEIQFDGFVFPAADQIITQLARMRLRSLGTVTMPVVIRVPYGGGIGAVEHHGESPEAYFAHTPGLRVVVCAEPADAFTMLRQAIASDDPVIFFEPKRCYWDKGEVDTAAAPDTWLPLHRAKVVRQGDDLTLVSYGAATKTCLAAAEEAAGEGRAIEVIDLRSLSPLDTGSLTESVTRTGRCVVVHEAPVFCGYGAELAARITQQCFYHLEAPVLRVGGYDTPYPPSRLEEYYLPDTVGILNAIDSSFEW
jgi:pyruvate dehydrogenase E1 component beta subunit